MASDEPRIGWRRGAILSVLLAALLLTGGDTFHRTTGTSVAAAHLFSIAQWEAANFHRKWLHLLWEFLPGKRPSREERLALIDEYLVVARQAQKEEDRLEGLHLRRSGSLTAGAIVKERSATSREYLDELLRTKDQLRGRAEEGLEAELSSVLIDEGLGGWLRILLPPVDIRFDEPPTILVTSRRDRIDLLETVLLAPDLDVLARDRLEKEMLEEHDLSALVDNLAGLATYPSMVSELYTLRTVLQTSAHEWIHHYFFFRPLGRSLRRSEEMFTLNETVADLAGRELGDTAFARMGGDLSVSSSRYQSGEERDPIFTSKMRETRLRVEELLAEGKIEEAERYMKERWWHMRLGGYYLRKLNQAYFAFRGRYGEGPASVSPIGDQARELRDLLPSTGAFIKTVSSVSSYQEFLDKLEGLRAKTAAESDDTP